MMRLVLKYLRYLPCMIKVKKLYFFEFEISVSTFLAALHPLSRSNVMRKAPATNENKLHQPERYFKISAFFTRPLQAIHLSLSLDLYKVN